MGYSALIGPLYAPAVDTDDRNAPVIALRVMPHHANPSGTCHGGMLMGLADLLLIFVARRELGLSGPLPTISLSGDFMTPVPLHAWVEGRGRVLRSGGSMCFVEGSFDVDGRPAVRVNGIVRLPQRR